MLTAVDTIGGEYEKGSGKEKGNIRSPTRGCTSDCTTLNEPACPPALAAGSSGDCGMYTRMGTLRKSREVFRSRELTLLKEA